PCGRRPAVAYAAVSAIIKSRLSKCAMGSLAMVEPRCGSCGRPGTVARRYCAGPLSALCGNQVIAPILKQLPPLFKQRAPPICPLHGAANDVGQSHLDDVGRILCCLVRPDGEAGAEAVGC